MIANRGGERGSGPLPTDLAAAYAHCEAVARAHYENFPVASRLLPAAMRPHVAAVYAFARAADDFADEGDLAPAERYRLLDDWRARLHAPAPSASSGDPADRVFAAVAQTRRQCELDIQLFDDLLSAFRQDVETRRYAEWPAVLDYCRRSANPVGRLVLGIAGHRGRDVEQASDALCTALQLANFWQDFGVDYRRGRIYLPAEISGRRRAQEGDLAAGLWTDAWREAFAEAVRRTRILFDQGRPVADLVSGRLRWELRLTWLGGMRILERAAEPGRNPLVSRPTLGAADLPGLMWDAIRWRER
jgi:hydroxysqualene synthase